MKKILVLNYEFPPLGGGASPVSYELAKRLSEIAAKSVKHREFDKYFATHLSNTGSLTELEVDTKEDENRETGDVEEGYDIDVVTMGYTGLPKYEELNDHLRVYRVPCLRSKKELSHPWEQATYLVSAYLQCRKLLKQKKYDVCHAHFIIPTGILALTLKRKYNLPYIITAHGSDVLGYNKRFKFLYPLLVGRWRKILDGAKVIVSPSQFLKQEILKAYFGADSEGKNVKLPVFDKYFATHLSNTGSLTELEGVERVGDSGGSERVGDSEDAEDSGGLEGKVVVIPNGIDTSKFTPQAKKPYILSSGRLLPNKGFQYLIQAVSDEDLGWEVHIAGDGPMRAELEFLAKKSKTKIIFHGWLDNNGKEYKDLLEQASIFVLASEKENASMVLLEAMAAGSAIITTNASGTAETIENAGLLVSFADYHALGEAIRNIIRDFALLSHLQDEARQKIESKYAYTGIIDAYKELLV